MKQQARSLLVRKKCYICTVVPERVRGLKRQKEKHRLLACERQKKKGSRSAPLSFFPRGVCRQNQRGNIFAFVSNPGKKLVSLLPYEDGPVSGAAHPVLRRATGPRSRPAPSASATLHAERPPTLPLLLSNPSPRPYGRGCLPGNRRRFRFPCIPG